MPTTHKISTKRKASAGNVDFTSVRSTSMDEVINEFPSAVASENGCLDNASLFDASDSVDALGAIEAAAAVATLANMNNDSATANRPSETSNPYFIREEIHNGINMVRLRSNGKFHLDILAEDFFKLIHVKPGLEAMPDEDPLQFISWVKYPNRYMRPSIMEKCLRENHPLFASHYIIRSKQQPKVAARFDEAKANKQRRAGQANDMAAWIHGACAHNNRGSKSFCESTFIIGFDSKDIRQYFQAKTERIRMHGEIYGDCFHVKNFCANMLRGIDKEAVIKLHVAGNKKPVKMSPSMLYNAYHAGRASENNGLVMKSPKVAYNLTSQFRNKQREMKDD